MLRKRSRAVSSSSSTKQGLMPDPPLTLPSPTGKHCRPSASSLFPSPRLFVGFSAKGSVISDCGAAMSPTSILETKPFSSIWNPSDKSRRKPQSSANSGSRHHPWLNGERAVGLGIVHALRGDKLDVKPCKIDSRMVLFGSQLKIQIPYVQNGSMEAPNSPIEFGIKNKNSQLALLSPARRSSIVEVPPSPGVFTGCLSATEMEMSEDYTCVIAHGPNPRTTHIYDNCILQSCGFGFTPSRKESRFLADQLFCPLDDFLTFCHACRKSLGQGKDIFMYRGDKAFCSSECRYKEMLHDEGMEKKAWLEPLAETLAQGFQLCFCF